MLMNEAGVGPSLYPSMRMVAPCGDELIERPPVADEGTNVAETDAVFPAVTITEVW
jgi:hypothetical protein